MEVKDEIARYEATHHVLFSVRSPRFTSAHSRSGTCAAGLVMFRNAQHVLIIFGVCCRPYAANQRPYGSLRGSSTSSRTYSVLVAATRDRKAKGRGTSRRGFAVVWRASPLQ
ncbi:hypothetical protein PybrP1_002037 [[Pythium] brassicae (nom. inval.)]|nr:hypothetical protein PybrP1_002037 [[Pythium] brassicae (nom. inval.)]